MKEEKINKTLFLQDQMTKIKLFFPNFISNTKIQVLALILTSKFTFLNLKIICARFVRYFRKRDFSGCLLILKWKASGKFTIYIPNASNFFILHIIRSFVF